MLMHTAVVLKVDQRSLVGAGADAIELSVTLPRAYNTALVYPNGALYAGLCLGDLPCWR